MISGLPKKAAMACLEIVRGKERSEEERTGVGRAGG